MAVAAASVAEALGAATDALAAAGVDAPRLDAEVLLAEASGVDRARLASDPDAPVPAKVGRAFAGMVRRRVRREPVAYILGRRSFRHIEVAVDPRVLIPRPETELLVDVAIERAPRSVLEVGTGSGAVALAVADELPDATVIATDTSEAAVDVARANAMRLQMCERVSVRHGSVPDGQRFDLALANLPYVREDEWAELAPEITRYEPRDALVPGPTGLEAIADVLPRIDAEVVALEVGAGQAAAVARTVRACGFDRAEARRDLGGIERVVVGSR
ncbi:MAG TPA: peptide chain release factor N(5)-glutamine methyltransferase [Solirubrobacterales bacterium]|nr:peptide chain release factor N(5)-glutamine methyltransferase [Solirubrobacterales bacterium]